MRNGLIVSLGKVRLATVKLLTIFSVLFFLPLAAWAQCGAGLTSSSGAQVCLKVRFTDNNSPAAQLKVQLLSAENGLTVAETYTRQDGDAYFSGVSAGDYQLLVSGADIEDATASFKIERRQAVHAVAINVRRIASSAQSSDTSVSLATLNLPNKARQEFEKGMQAMEEAKLEDADNHFSKAVGQYPAYAAAWNARGVVCMRTEKWDGAKIMFGKAIAADSQFSEAYVNWAKVLIKEKKNTEAETLLTKSLSLSPRDPNALAVLANLDLNMGKLDEAITNARRVHDLPHANLSAAHLIAAMALEKKQLYAEAASEYRQFLQEAPNSTSAGRIRAQVDALEKRLH